MKVLPLNDPDRAIELQNGLRDMLTRIIDKLNSAGFSTAEVLDALGSEVLARWKLHDTEADPTDEPV